MERKSRTENRMSPVFGKVQKSRIWAAGIQISNYRILWNWKHFFGHIFMFLWRLFIHGSTLFPFTKELLVGFLSVKVTWFTSYFSETWNKMLDLHRDSSSLQNQTLLPVANLSCIMQCLVGHLENPIKGRSALAMLCVFRSFSYTQSVRDCLSRHTVQCESYHFWTAWHQQICISMKIYLYSFTDYSLKKSQSSLWLWCGLEGISKQLWCPHVI